MRRSDGEGSGVREALRDTPGPFPLHLRQPQYALHHKRIGDYERMMILFIGFTVEGGRTESCTGGIARR